MSKEATVKITIWGKSGNILKEFSGSKNTDLSSLKANVCRLKKETNAFLTEIVQTESDGQGLSLKEEEIDDDEDDADLGNTSVHNKSSNNRPCANVQELKRKQKDRDKSNKQKKLS